MSKNVIIFIYFMVIFSYAGKFEFSVDTVGEDGVPYPKETYIRNLSADSVYIDSIMLFIDTIKYPKFQMEWVIFPYLYKFGNIFVLGSYFGGYIPLNMYQNNYPIISISSKDSVKLKSFNIDKVLFFPTTYNEKKDSIVPITIKLVFYSKDYSDTLFIKGNYNYNLQISTGIQNHTIVKIIKKALIQKPSYFYTCSGRNIDSDKIFSRTGNGIYISRLSGNKIIKVENNIIIVREASF